MKGSIDSIETFGLVDGPGIRTVIFLNGCSLRCKFCHNPETWKIKELNYTSEEIVEKVKRNKPYFSNGGGVTFSGGEPLIQYEYLVNTCRLLKKEDIHIAIDTAGIGNGDYTELFNTIDMVLLDIKDIDRDGYKEITGADRYLDFIEFVKELNKTNLEVWIRQVIVPGVNDNSDYIKGLSRFIKDNINNVTRVDFLPYHKMGVEKYEKLGIEDPYKDVLAMDKDKCDMLYKEFLEEFK
jgi:pyruvate formate lyase activating enzyme